jgi:hypothetical protein
MNITKEYLWTAIYTVIPESKKVFEAGIHMNLTDYLKDSAVALFMIPYHQKTNAEQTVEYIIRDTLRELKQEGFITFTKEST